MEKRFLEGMFGTYRLGDLIERTSWCNVYRAYRKGTQPGIYKDELAAKQIFLDFDCHHRRRETFDEFNAHASRYLGLSHPNLARVVDYLPDGLLHYTVFEFVPGLRLGVLLDRHHIPVNEDLVLALAADMARGLAYLHSQPEPLIFGDLSPSSVIITPSGEARLTDYGLSRCLVERKANEPLLGTPGYAAPEQYGEKATLSVATDVYALGAVLWHVLTLREPEYEEVPLAPVRQYHPQTSLWLENFVRRCTDPDPAKRYPDMLSILSDLHEVAPHTQPEAEQPPTTLKPFQFLASLLSGRRR